MPKKIPSKKKVVKKKATKKKAVQKKPVKKPATKKKSPKKKTTRKCGAPKGNHFWKARSTHGRKPIFDKPETLWTASVEYFEWVEANPLYESKAFSYQGRVTLKQIPRMRAMTINGLCIFLDINHETWTNYKKKDDFLGVTSQVENIIKDQKFAGAACDLLNANIIARDLGLKDKQELRHTGSEDDPVRVNFYIPKNNRDAE